MQPVAAFATRIIAIKLYTSIGMFVSLMMWAIQVCGQSPFTISGKVLDGASHAPVPFVHISVLNHNVGTVTDIDGKFNLQLPQKTGLSLEFTHVSYKTLKLPVETLRKSPGIRLYPKREQLEEVVVIAGENPAHEIIRNVVANRNLHDPNQLNAYSYHSYNKVYGTLEGYQKDTIDESIGRTSLDSMLSNNHFMMVESQTKKTYRKPNVSNETVVANKVSGYKNPIFSVVPTDLQPVAFYRDHITLLEEDFLNPISPGSTGKYHFTLEDTIYNASGNEAYVITFQPREDKNFNGLSGILHINAADYAIINVEAKTAIESMLIEARIRQKYEKIDGEHWFPVQYTTQYTFKRQLIRNRPMVAIGKSYISNIQINKVNSDLKLDHLDLKIAADAHKKDSAYWNNVRPVKLSKREQNTYAFYDNHPQIKTIRSLYKIMEVVVLGYVTTGPIDLSIDELYHWNRYEGHRLGIALNTNNSLADWVKLRGAVAFGSKDNALKYGGGIDFNLSSLRDIHLEFNYAQDLEEPANADLLTQTRNRFSSEAFRDWLITRMDSVQTYQMKFRFRPIPHLKAAVTLTKKHVQPTYEYQYATNDGELTSSFNLTETSISLIYRPREKLAKIRDLQLMMEPAYPELAIEISKGVEWLNGHYDYYKANLKVEHAMRIRSLGQTFLRLDAGWSGGDMPYPVLYNAPGSKFRSLPIIIDYHFQTMGLYEFVSDRYTNLFFKHDFGRLLYNPKSKIFKPEPALTHNIGWGTLNQRSQHRQLEFNTMEDIYLESGLVIKNILRINYLDFAYIGLGGGIFYRYGAYALPKTVDNMDFKFVLDVSI